MSNQAANGSTAAPPDAPALDSSLPIDPRQAEELWTSSTDRVRAEKRRSTGRVAGWVAAVMAIIGAIVVAIGLALGIQEVAGIGGLVLGLSFYVALFALTSYSAASGLRRRFFEREESIARALAVRTATARVEDRLSLESLFIFNRALMDEYHSITRQQSEKSFRNSQWASFIGLLVLVAGATVLFFPVPDVAKVTAAVLSGVGTVLAGFISKTFLTSHQLSIRQLNNFFRQPLVSNYLLMAERLSQSLDSPQKHKATLRIVEKAIESATKAESQNENLVSSRAPGRARRRPSAKPDEPRST